MLGQRQDNSRAIGLFDGWWNGGIDARVSISFSMIGLTVPAGPAVSPVRAQSRRISTDIVPIKTCAQ